MAHLGDRVTEYVFGEMSAAEMTAARAHIQECSECARQVGELQHTRSLLQVMPDAEPPRSIVFEVERKRVTKAWLWKWAAPAAAALAASILTATLMAPNEQWMAAELEKRDRAHEMDLQRVRGEIAYWERQQQAVSRETLDTAAAVQVLAERYRSKTDGD